jgi:hypothetical protein
MAQTSRSGPLVANQFPSPQQRALQERARRTRWLAAMTVDAAARTELVSYADELERQAEATGDKTTPPILATEASLGRRDAG